MRLTESVDPKGQRAEGTLTKVGLKDSGAEGSAAALLEGTQHELKLGRSILRNPGQKQPEDPNFDRHTAERKVFRAIAPSNGIDKGKVVVESLRLCLYEVLAAYMRREDSTTLLAKATIKDKLNRARSK